MKTADVKKSLSNELVRIEEEMYLCYDAGRGISTSRRRRTAVSSSRSPPSRARRLHCSSSCSVYSVGSPNWRCRSAAKATDRTPDASYYSHPNHYIMFHLINLTNLIHSVPSLAQHHARVPIGPHAPLFHSPKRDKHNSPAAKSR